MTIDTSALVAILKTEEGYEDLILNMNLSSADLLMSAASYVELGIVIDKLADPILSRRVDELLFLLRIEVVPVSAEQAKIAREAYRDFGKGSGHPASLNYGDSFSYALARELNHPILCTGNDFAQTDLQLA